ncbi:MAG: ATP synthase F1 subunit gamma [Clostridia bacterium]|nr:ATP synthase F1 subunit gamma [Clostridia bacterium]
MPDTKQLRNRIRSVNSTLHLTHAMELVAASKIKKASERMTGSNEYACAAAEAMAVLAACPACEKSPYLRSGMSGETRLMVIAGDRGMAGGYNANIYRLAREYPDAKIIPVGKRAYERFGGDAFYGAEAFSTANARKIAEKLCGDFLEGAFGRFGILYTRYISMMQQEASVRWILPLDKREARSSGKDIVFEPDEVYVMSSLVPEYVTGMIMASVRESFASEVAARRMAMDSAGKNARQMIDDLTIKYNRARQGAITQEITEIVAGSGS